MIANLKKIFSNTASKQIEVKMLRSCFVGGRQYIEGDVISFDDKTALELCAQGIARDPAAEAAGVVKSQSLASLLPPLGEVRPLPEGWDKLPECFALHFNRLETGRVLFQRRDEIEKRLIARITTRTFPDLRSTAQLDDAQSKMFFKNFSFSVGEMPQAELEALAHLRDCHQRAVEVVNDWKATNSVELTRLSLACGDHVQTKHGLLCRSVRELHAMALELFGTRIAALGLSQRKTTDLFSGSADAERYCKVQEPGLSDRRLAWHDANCDPKLYLDTSVENMAQMLFNWMQIEAEVTALTKQCKSDLAKASKVAA